MSAKTDTSMTIRVNKDIKLQAQRVFNELGMDMTTAVNLFLRQAIRFNGIPFELKNDEIPNAETMAAFEEGEKMLRDPDAMRFSSVDDLFEELYS